MARVITFSRTFPAHHPKAGQPTFFVEKVWKSLWDSYNGSKGRVYPEWLNYVEAFPNDVVVNIHHVEPKHHTIRAGKRWKEGDWFSPRVWSGKPYASKQIQFAPDIQIKKVWGISIKQFVDDWYIDFGNHSIPMSMPHAYTALPMLARNDGLLTEDLLDWFKYPKTFEGQILCWNEEVNY